MDIKFRKAVSSDIENIIELCNLCFEEKTSIQYAKKIFEETKDDKNQIYLVGYANDVLVAHAKITIIPTIYEKMNVYSILNHVCVRPDYRRHNIATRMLIECENISRQHNCVKMELWSNNTRQPAHECYKNYGFVIEDAKFFSKDVVFSKKVDEYELL